MKKRHLAMVVLGLAAAAWLFSGKSETRDARLIVDRPWVSDVPKDPREAFHALFLEKKGMGATLVGSRYQHLISAVSYKLDKDKLQLNFLQQEFKIAGKVKAYKCKAPKDLDLCLEIDYRWKKIRLYSSSKWGKAKDVPEWLRLLPASVPEVEDQCESCREGEPSWLSSYDEDA